MSTETTAPPSTPKKEKGPRRAGTRVSAALALIAKHPGIAAKFRTLVLAPKPSDVAAKELASCEKRHATEIGEYRAMRDFAAEVEGLDGEHMVAVRSVIDSKLKD